MKTAAIYTRVSSERQKQQRTIGSQVDALIEYAQANAYGVPDEWVFEDEGYSGAVLVRPGLERVRDLAAEGQIEAVLVYSPDRLSRKYAYQVLLVEEFARQGVEMVFIQGPKASTPEGQLLVHFQGMIAEYERAQIAERSRRGKRHRAKQGSVNVLSGAPYGYRYIKKTETSGAYYQVIESEATMVRKVFGLYTQAGLSINAIAHWLNEHEVPTRRGAARWCRSTVWAMLRNPAYRGRACFGKTEASERRKTTRALRQRGGYSARNSANRERPRDEWIEIAVPPLVNDAMFALAAEQLENNKRYATRRTIEPSLLQGMLVCNECGYAYYRTSTRTAKRKLHYYRCLGSDDYRYRNGRVCHNRPVRQDYVDELVWQHVIELLVDPTLIRAEIDRRIKAVKKSSLMTRRRDAVERNLARVRNGIDNLLEAYQESLLQLEELRARIPPLRKREKTLLAELHDLKTAQTSAQGYLRLADTLHTFLSRLRTCANTLSVIERQKVLRLVVKEVLIDDETIQIKHSIPVTLPDAPGGNFHGGDTPGYLLRSGSDLTAIG